VCIIIIYQIQGAGIKGALVNGWTSKFLFSGYGGITNPENI